MNERIKELEDQASQYASRETTDLDEWEFIFRKKFAELVIRECANIVSNKSTLETNEDYREGFHRAQQFIWQDINKHFGVK